jgi:hypothetical protein
MASFVEGYRIVLSLVAGLAVASSVSAAALLNERAAPFVDSGNRAEAASRKESEITRLLQPGQGYPLHPAPRQSTEVGRLCEDQEVKELSRAGIDPRALELGVYEQHRT